MKEKLLQMGLTEEQADSVMDAFKDFIPKARFNEINDKYKSVRQELEQLETLKSTSGEVETLKQQMEALKEAHAAEIKQIRINSAIDSAITMARGKNTKAIRALLDMDSITVAEDGTIKGLSEQIKTLKEAKDSEFLFGSDVPEIKGAKPGESRDPYRYEQADIPEGIALRNAMGLS
ncbi:MAG: phage scaffolding protein [Eubacteriales bacterium]|nr:phage scaffolding protein [Eubacteriales bacterium]